MKMTRVVSSNGIRYSGATQNMTQCRRQINECQNASCSFVSEKGCCRTDGPASLHLCLLVSRVV